MADPRQVLGDHGLVGPQLMRQRRHRRRGGQRPQDRAGGVAGEHLGGEEHQHAQDPQGDQPQADALEDEDDHQAVLRASRRPRATTGRPWPAATDRSRLPRPPSTRSRFFHTLLPLSSANSPSTAAITAGRLDDFVHIGFLLRSMALPAVEGNEQQQRGRQRGDVLGVMPGARPRLGGGDAALARRLKRRLHEPRVHGHGLARADEVDRGRHRPAGRDLVHRGADGGFDARQRVRGDPADVDGQAGRGRG